MSRPWAKTPLYAVWVVELAPCWKCGQRTGDVCVTKDGLPTRPHESRYRLATAIRDKAKFNGSHRTTAVLYRGTNQAAWEDAAHPHVFRVNKARKEHPDSKHPDRPIQPGEAYFMWKPDSVGLMKSRTRPVIGDDGILFWPTPETP